MRKVDVVIIGGSLAGATCVRELTCAGIDAVAIERDRFPREKVCGGFLSPGAVGLLDEMDLLATLRNAGAVPVSAARVRSAGIELEMEFRRPGLGVSRRLLDAVLADHPAVEHGHVLLVERGSDGRFLIRLDDGREFDARFVIDAAGKSSRFAMMQTSPQFGVQFYEAGSCGDVMDFWFFDDGYGGTVGIEGNRSNSCFLIRREVLPQYLGKPGCQVTGPVAYRSQSSEFIGVGDAAGMIDPFCGEGMHHALDTGRIAAGAVIQGLGRGWEYSEIRQYNEAERSRRWARKRALARAARIVLRVPRLRDAMLRTNPAWFVERFWSDEQP